MNPWLELQEETLARLQAHEFLTTIPMVNEVKGDVTNRIQTALVKGGLKANDERKVGLALLIMTPKGRADQRNTRTVSPQITIVRIALFVKPLLNDGANGLQKAPLDVHYAVMQQMLSWQRGPGHDPIQLLEWDSDETPNGELSYFADYEVPQFITPTPASLFPPQPQ